MCRLAVALVEVVKMAGTVAKVAAAVASSRARLWVAYGVWAPSHGRARGRGEKRSVGDD